MEIAINQVEDNGIKIKELCLDIISQEWVLVIGNDLLLSSEVEKTGNINNWYSNYIYSHFIKGVEAYKPQTLEELCENHKNIHKHIRFLANTVTWEENDVNQYLLKLFKRKLFPVVITTEFDPLLEQMMKLIWGDVDVKGIFDEDNDYRNIRKSQYNTTKPILYYAFGKAYNNDNYFVADDDDKILAIKRWITKGPKNFLQFISTKNLLAVGCDLKDWLFRFFWHIIRNPENIKSIEDGTYKKGNVAISLRTDISDSDKQLSSYLQKKDALLSTCPIDFLRDLAETIEAPSFEKLFLEKKRKQNGIFLSYSSTDKEFTLHMFRYLTEAGLNVWMDERIKEGAEEYDNIYNIRISEAIKQCNVFVPILGAAARKHLTNEDYDHFYMKEWRDAQSFRESRKDSSTPMLIQPVSISGFVGNENPAPEVVRERFQSFFKHKDSNDKRENLSIYSFTTWTDLINLLKERSLK